MDFRGWFLNEAKLDPEVLRRRKEKYNDKTFLSNEILLQLDPEGNIISKNILKDRPWLTLDLSQKYITLHNMGAQSKEFRTIMNTIEPYYPDIKNWDVQAIGTSGTRRITRKVSYWLSRPEVHLAEGLPPYLYHGTSTNLWYEGIKEGDLAPRNMTGSTGSFGAANLQYISREGLVYLSSDPDFATRTAASQAANKHGGKPLILRISTEGLNLDQFVADEDSGVDTAQGSLNQRGTVAYRGKISKKNIEPFLIKDTSRDAKWVKFYDVEIGEHPLTVSLRDGVFNDIDSAEYFALLDAGLIDMIDGRPYVVDPKKITDAQVKSALRSAFWSTNARMIYNDLSGHGLLNYLRNKYMDQKTFDSPYIQLLIKNGIIEVKRAGIEKYLLELVYFEPREKPKVAISLAKSLGRESYSWFIEDLKKHLNP